MSDRFPNAVIDTTQILSGEREFRIHPADARELREAMRFCWPDNAPRDFFYGVRLIEDVEAPRLPRKPL